MSRAVSRFQTIAFLQPLFLCLAVSLAQRRQLHHVITFPTAGPVRNDLDLRDQEQVRETLGQAIAAVRRTESLLQPPQNNSHFNWVVSPLSLAIILGELHLGASGPFHAVLGEAIAPRGSSTPGLGVHRQLGMMLKYLQQETNTFQLHTDGALFTNTDMSVKHSYKHALFDLYGTEVFPVDFSGSTKRAVNTINNWVYKATKGMISEIGQYTITASTLVLLVNTLYLRGAWQFPFDPNLTMTSTFRVNESTQVAAQFMLGEMEVQYATVPQRGLKVIGIPYKKAHLTMYVAFSDKPNSNLNELTGDDLTEWMETAKFQRGIVVLPKLNISSTTNVGQTLSRIVASRKGKVPMTMRSASLDPRFKVDDIIQHVVLEVNELGTEVAAVTSTLTDHFGGVPVFRVNSPFRFWIQHQSTGVNLFTGVVRNPND